MKAVIMAGGIGNRLRPLTCDIPKPMVPVLNRPVMEYSVDLLKKYGIVEIAVTLQYLPEKIREYFGDGSKHGVQLKYYVEKTPLGTAGSVKAAADMLNETFVVVSGDALTDIDLSAAIHFHKEKGSIATLVLKKVDLPLEYGVVLVDKDKKIQRFLEKPSIGEVFSDLANTGIYILEPEVFNWIEDGKPVDFSKDIFPKLLESRQKMFGFVTGDYWCDIGDISQYLQANRDLLDRKCKADLNASNESDIWIENGAKIDNRSIIKGPCYIASGVKIEGGVAIEPYSVLCSGAVIEKDCRIKRSVIWKDARIRKEAEIVGAIVCNGSDIKEKSTVFENAVIGARADIGIECTIKPNVMIWPEKKIEDYSKIESNIVWGNTRKTNLFGQEGITGYFDTELDPVTAARFGCALGSLYQPLSTLAIGCDGENASVIFEHAFVSGLLSMGVDICDFDRLTLPVFRYGIRYLGLSGGAYVKVLKNENSKLMLSLYDSKGYDAAPAFQRKVQVAFDRMDFKPVSLSELGIVRMRREITPFYMAELLRKANKESMRVNPYKAVIFGPVQSRNILFELLNNCGWQVYSSDTTERNYALEVIKQRADIGFCISDNQEVLTIIDKEGQKLDDNSTTALLVKALAVSGENLVVLPVDVPAEIENFALRNGTKVIRTTSWKRSRMCASEEQSNDIWFDAVAAALKIASCCSKTGLHSFMSQIPSFHVQKQDISCSWKEIGKILRTIVETEPADHSQLIDGIRIKHENGWVLVRPKHTVPGFKIICDGLSEEYAEELTDLYLKKINYIMKNIE